MVIHVFYRMPLIKRQVVPAYISRRRLPSGEATDFDDDDGRDYDLTAVSNTTLCGALQQLGSLLAAAKDISEDLHAELDEIVARTGRLAGRVSVLTGSVERYNPRDVPVRKLMYLII